jgi:hypothetical protein
MIAKLREHVNLIILRQNFYTIMSVSQPLQSYAHLNVYTVIPEKQINEMKAEFICIAELIINSGK